MDIDHRARRFAVGRAGTAGSVQVFIGSQDNATFLQIEGIGILKGANSRHLAKKFIDFALGEQFQEDFPAKMFVYPVNPDAATPDFFKFADVPSQPANISADEIGKKREAWIDAWTEVVLR